MPDFERARSAYALRLQGLKLREIGERMAGLGKGQARQLVWKGERIAKAEATLKEVPDDVRSLVVLGHIPNRYGWILAGEGIETLRQLSEYGERALLYLPGMGRRGIEHLSNVLTQHGLEFAKDPMADPGWPARKERWRQFHQGRC